MMPTVKIDDITLYYDKKGSGEPLVLLHGAQGDSSSFAGIVDVLSERFTVINFDQRGSGKSSKPDVEYTMALLAKDTAQLMEALSIDSAHIFGISLGGMIAQSFCVQFPEKVKTVTLGCTLPGGWDEAQKKDPPADALIAFSSDDQIPEEERARALANVAYSPGYADRHPEIIPRLIEARKAAPVDAVGMKRRLDMTGLYHAFSDLKKMTQPCLVVTGKQDQLLDYRNSLIIAEQIKQATLFVLGHSGHIFWEEEKSLFLSTFFSFIEESRSV